jgi:hypothetical protein
MCMALYLGSDRPIPLMPWEEGRSPIWARALSDDEAVRAKFSKKHVSYVGAWEGCGCGFQYGTLPDVDEGDEHELQCRSSVEALRTLLSERLAHESDIELFACWEGDQETSIEHSLEVSTGFFEGEAFQLRERTLYHVTAAA